jgi:hypothetical protein
MQAHRKKTKQRTQKRVVETPEPEPITQTPDLQVPEEIQQTLYPTAPDVVEIEESKLMQEIESVLNTEVSEQVPKTINYPMLMALPELISKSKEEEVIQAKVKSEAEATGHLFKSKNSQCIRCCEDFDSDGVSVISACKHAQHLICYLETTSSLKEDKLCYLCTSAKLTPETQEETKQKQQEEDEEPYFTIDSGNDKQARRRMQRLQEKQKKNNNRLQFVDELISHIDSDDEEYSNDNNNNSKKLLTSIEESYIIDVAKVYDLCKSKGLIQSSGIWGAWDSVKSIFNKGEIKNVLDQDCTLTYDFLIKNNITLDDLRKNNFVEADLYFGVGVRTVPELAKLKLQTKHFTEGNFFPDFEDFLAKYDTNFTELDEALDPVYLHWILEKCENKPMLLKKLQIDFKTLIEDLLLTKSELIKTRWTIDDCIYLGATTEHLLKLKLNVVDFTKDLKWDVREFEKKFELKARTKEKFGIRDEVTGFIESAIVETKSKKKRTKKITN